MSIHSAKKWCLPVTSSHKNKKDGQTASSHLGAGAGSGANKAWTAS